MEQPVHQERIVCATPKEYAAMLEVWEASVRATHHFLTEADICALRPQVAEAFQQTEHLYCLRDSDGVIGGFVGIAGRKVEMLFLSPRCCGCGMGRKLLVYAQNAHQAAFVDVNEQNEAAVAFYRHLGYRVFDRSPLDDAGRSFPILHMRCD